MPQGFSCCNFGLVAKCDLQRPVFDHQLHQITYGLVLIGGFSLGLTSVLTILGLAAVYGQQWLEKSPLGAGVMQRLSVVSSLATVCTGLSLSTVALMG